MSHDITWLQRLRIERRVWTLDQQLYDLPSRSRIAKRREVRGNLLTAARDIGTAEALRRLGGTRHLAQEYLNAELGDGPRHSWVAAAYFCGSVPLVLNFFLSEAASAYEQGITDANAHTSGILTWNGIRYLQSAITYTFDQGHSSHTGGAWTPLTFILWAMGTIACGRLWRLLPMAKAGRRRTVASP